MAKNNSTFQHYVECGYSIKVPNMSDIEERVNENITKLIKDKQKNINNG